MALNDDIRRVAQLLHPERWSYAIGLLALALLNLADVFGPLFLALAIEIIDASVTHSIPAPPSVLGRLGVDGETFSLAGAVFAFLGLGILANALRYPMLTFTAIPSHRIGQTLRRSIAEQLLRQSQSFYDRTKSGDVMAIATADVNSARMMLGPAILVGADTIMLTAMVLAAMFSMSWQLALVALAPLPVIYLVTNRFSHMEYEGFEAVQEDLASMTERARESYAGIRILQGYARESHDRRRFGEYSLRHYAKNMWLARVRAAFEPTLDFMIGVSTVLIIVFGGLEIVAGNLAIGSFVAFLFLIRYLAGPMVGLGWSISLFQRGRASLHRIDELTRAPIEIVDPPTPTASSGDGAIAIRGLTFSYPSPRADGPDIVLDDLSFDVPAGATVGIFGPVGSGKSTVAKLLTRLYDPPPGTVFLDGVDIRELSLHDLRRRVVLAPQETFLFSTTVSRNIALGADVDMAQGLADDRVRELATLAHLHRDIDELESGYETMLGERGVNLSGGQRQRLAIARAMAADPDVLVLDDCLSAVDGQTEAVILENLKQVFAGRTGVVISHRVRAVQNCHEIIVLKGGALVERGVHEELLGRSGYYAQIAEQQLRGEDGEPEP